MFLQRLRMCQGVCIFGLFFGVFVLVGCNSGGNGEDFTAAGASDLTNQRFAFSDGAAFGLAGQATTLTVGDFGLDGDDDPMTGPFTLTSAAGTATGTLTVGSCTLLILTTSFDAGQFPGLQSQQTLVLDPCNVNMDDGSLEVVNTVNTATSTSGEPIPAGGSGAAFVLTTDFSTGSYSVIDLATRNMANDIDLGGVNSDAIVRVFNGLVYVINRFGADNIQLIDPQQGYLTIAQESVGNGSNPQDIAVVSPTKAYVSRLGSGQLLIVSPTSLATLGTIDLSDLTNAADTDGIPELFRMLVHDGLVYLSLQHLDFNAGVIPAQVAPGDVVVLDPDTDTVVTVISLHNTNPFSDLQYSPALDRILVSAVGAFTGSGGGDDGGIEAIDPTTLSVDAALVLSESAVGGDITHFAVVSATQGFAIVLDGAFQGSLISFNPSTGEPVSTLVPPTSTVVSHFAINDAGELYLAITDLTTPAPGIRIFDTAQGTELTATPLRVGQLPPNYVAFVE